MGPIDGIGVGVGIVIGVIGTLFAMAAIGGLIDLLRAGWQWMLARCDGSAETDAHADGSMCRPSHRTGMPLGGMPKMRRSGGDLRALGKHAVPRQELAGSLGQN